MHICQGKEDLVFEVKTRWEALERTSADLKRGSGSLYQAGFAPLRGSKAGVNDHIYSCEALASPFNCMAPPSPDKIQRTTFGLFIYTKYLMIVVTNVDSRLTPSQLKYTRLLA